MLLGTNPEEFTVSQNKMMGLWPLSGLFADGVMPYINRMKNPKVSVLEIEPAQGNNMFRFIEKDEKHKIDQYFYERTSTAFTHVWNQNVESLPKDFRLYEHSKEKVDVVLVNTEWFTATDASKLDKTIENGYNDLFTDGIFCISGHDTTLVKEALSRFRRSHKISAPIHVVNRSICFWYKP